MVGKECRANLHKNTLILGGTDNFHSKDHDFSSLASFDDPLLPSSHSSLCNFVLLKNLYAELMVNLPFLSGYHAQKSSVFRVHTGILRITSALKGRNTEHTKPSFHDAVVGESNSELSCGEPRHVMLSILVWSPSISIYRPRCLLFCHYQYDE